eukprot:6464763-Amphidinium_carterae.1
MHDGGPCLGCYYNADSRTFLEHHPGLAPLQVLHGLPKRLQLNSTIDDLCHVSHIELPMFAQQGSRGGASVSCVAGCGSSTNVPPALEKTHRKKNNPPTQTNDEVGQFTQTSLRCSCNR